MYVYIYLYMFYVCMYRHINTCARDGYGRACGCTASHARVRAICARRRCGRRHHVRAWVRPPVYIADAHVMYEYIYIDAKSGYVNGHARAFSHTRAIACGR